MEKNSRFKGCTSGYPQSSTHVCLSCKIHLCQDEVGGSNYLAFDPPGAVHHHQQVAYQFQALKKCPCNLAGHIIQIEHFVLSIHFRRSLPHLLLQLLGVTFPCHDTLGFLGQVLWTPKRKSCFGKHLFAPALVLI